MAHFRGQRGLSNIEKGRAVLDFNEAEDGGME